MSSTRITLLALFANVTLAHSVRQPKRQFDEAQYFDRNAPSYETVLTPNDFEQGAKLSKTQHSEIENWDSDEMYHGDRFEGDIAMDLNATTVELFLHGALSRNDKMFNAVKNRHQLWPNGRIPYAISSQYSSYSRSMIAASMQEYSTHTCIHWVPKTNNDANYVYIMPDRGCYSMVGKTGGRQTLSLGSGCIQKGIIIHELMHAVGFFHEQSRTDRDDYITIMWNNIQPGMQGQFEKYGHGTIQSLGAEYDYGSIMHYGSRAFSRNGQPTIVPKKTASIGQRSGFSKIDSYKINKLYECSAAGSSPVPTTTQKTTPKVTNPTTSTPSPTPYPSPPTLRPLPPIIITLPPITLPPVTKSSSTATPPPLPSTIIDSCKNTRHDCPQLAAQGWCKRNPAWMKQYCPESCGMCEKKPAPACEDLRVDCAQLVQARYCKTSQTFMKTYCAKSCGFCFVAPATEVPDTTPVVPTIVTQQPFVTFWPTLKPRSTLMPSTASTTTTTTRASSTSLTTADPTDSPPTPHPCRDRKHFCVHWKNAGFCEGIFLTYMKKNCPQACGMC